MAAKISVCLLKGARASADVIKYDFFSNFTSQVRKFAHNNFRTYVIRKSYRLSIWNTGTISFLTPKVACSEDKTKAAPKRLTFTIRGYVQSAIFRGRYYHDRMEIKLGISPHYCTLVKSFFFINFDAKFN